MSTNRRPQTSLWTAVATRVIARVSSWPPDEGQSCVIGAFVQKMIPLWRCAAEDQSDTAPLSSRTNTSAISNTHAASPSRVPCSRARREPGDARRSGGRPSAVAQSAFDTLKRRGLYCPRISQKDSAIARRAGICACSPPRGWVGAMRRPYHTLRYTEIDSVLHALAKGPSFP